jgi:hypothetical protein
MDGDIDRDKYKIHIKKKPKREQIHGKRHTDYIGKYISRDPVIMILQAG